MSTDNYTAEDLGITGPHLVAHTIDGDDWIVIEVLDYRTDRVDVTARTQHRTVEFLYYSPGIVGLTSALVSPEDLRVVIP